MEKIPKTELYQREIPLLARLSRNRASNLPTTADVLPLLPPSSNVGPRCHWIKFAEQKLFRPLGISNYEWLKDAIGKPIDTSVIRFRPRDFAKITSIYLNNEL